MKINENISQMQNKIEWSLFLLRLGVFIVMLVWTLDKLSNPGHGVRVFEHYLFIKGMANNVVMVMGVAELIIVAAFVLGLWKRYSYGFILIIHTISTLSSWKQYTTEFNLLFFAAWPMLAAIITLYLLRDLDVKFTISFARPVTGPAR